MAAPWEKVNPDNAIDRLPQPYRAINKILEDVLSAVGDHITEIESKRKSEEYEHALQEVAASTCIQISGRVTSANSEPKGSARVAIGTSHGEAWLIDMNSKEVVAQTRAFAEDEAVNCITLSSDGAYAPRPQPPGKDEALPAPRSPVKLFVAGTVTPRIFVYNIIKEAYGVLLKPACAIHVPRPDGGREAAARPVVEQLHTRGTNDGIWVLALLCDRSIRVYLCPLGAPDDRNSEGGTGGDAVLDRPIMEDEEEENEEGEGQAGSDFDGVAQVKVPTYAFQLCSLAPLPSLPEPGLDRLALTVFAQRAEVRSIAAGTAARQVPLICMVSSPDSNVLMGYCAPAPPLLAAPAGLDADALLRQTMPQVGELRDPAATMSLRPRRRWGLPAEITSAAASPCGSVFAAGGARGALALVDTAGGLSMRTMLPGHYAAVRALSFHRAEVLVSVGADSWVHHYSLQDNTLLVRYLCAPPPSPPPLQGVVVAQSMPVAISLDARGGLRLLDLKRGRKMARATCHEAPAGAAPAAGGLAGRGVGTATASGVEAEGQEDPLPVAEERPRRVLASSAGFCVVCEARLEELQAQAQAEREARGAAEAEGGAGEEAEAEGDGEGEIDRSWLVLFDFATMLKSLYPSLAAKAERGGGALVEAFNSLVLKDAPKEKPPPPAPTAPTARAAAQPGLGPKGRAAMLQGGGVAKLTAENLRRMGKPGEQMFAQNSMISSGPGLGPDMESTALADKEKKHKKLHDLPENWQVSVRRYLRAGFAEKDARQRRIGTRLEMLRKELGDG